MRTKYRQPSSQYVFGYQKFILMPEDYKATKSGKVNVKLPEVVGKGYGTFWRWKGRYRAVKGSRASKKSKTTALWYITNMMKYPDANTLVVRKTYRTLKDVTVNFGGGKVDTGQSKVHVHLRSQRLQHYGTSPI